MSGEAKRAGPVLASPIPLPTGDDGLPARPLPVRRRELDLGETASIASTSRSSAAVGSARRSSARSGGEVRVTEYSRPLSLRQRPRSPR